jgi:hypothetical protein
VGSGGWSSIGGERREGSKRAEREEARQGQQEGKKKKEVGSTRTEVDGVEVGGDLTDTDTDRQRQI